MSRTRDTEAVKLVISVFSAYLAPLNESIKALIPHFGKPDYVSARLPFDYTDYYEREMGASLIRRLVSFELLVRPESLPDIKRLANQMEDQYREGGQRRVNIDPGYISLAHLILATGKGYTHRPYLRDGIYADLTLIFSGKTFRSLPWTYPDYAGNQMIGLFNKMREKYLLDLKKSG